MMITKIHIKAIRFNHFPKSYRFCENGNEEIVYDMLWQGEAYTPEMAKMAQSAKEEILKQ